MAADLSVPLSALSPSTHEKLCNYLNAPKILLSDEGVIRDWRGLAEKIGIPNADIRVFEHFKNQCSKVLEQWSRMPNHQQKHPATLASLQSLIGDIDRFDIVDDTRELFERDAVTYLTRKEEFESSICDEDILTADDQIRQSQNLPLEMFDVLLLFSDTEKDHEYAAKITKHLEDQGLKVCIKDRDLLAGVFENQATINLIATRCRRVVAIYSKEFLETKMNKFLVSFTQSIGIRTAERKLIPVCYERCNIPPEINFSFPLTINHSLYNFYDKLYQSVRPNVVVSSSVKRDAVKVEQSSTTKKVTTEVTPVDSLFLCDKDPQSTIVSLENGSADTEEMSSTKSSKSFKSKIGKMLRPIRGKSKKKEKKTKIAVEN